MEFLLANHPLDCPICDQGGECDLQVDVKSFNPSSMTTFLHASAPGILLSSHFGSTTVRPEQSSTRDCAQFLTVFFFSVIITSTID